MAKITLTDISSGYLSTATFNANNTLIEAAIEKTLSRDGTTPNTMSANLDMNSNAVTNITDGANNQDAVSLAQLNAAKVVASTIAATAVTFADSGGKYAATTAEAAFAELASINLGEGAGIIGIADFGGYFAGAHVEAALQNLGANRLLKAGTETINGEWLFAGKQSFSDDVDLASANLLMTDGQITRARLTDFAITSTSPSSSSNAITLDFALGNAFQTTLSENITTVTLSNPPATGNYGEIIWKVIQDSSARTITWPASVKWPGGTAPTISTGSGAIDIIVLKTWDAGTTYFADFQQAYS